MGTPSRNPNSRPPSPGLPIDRRPATVQSSQPRNGSGRPVVGRRQCGAQSRRQVDLYQVETSLVAASQIVVDAPAAPLAGNMRCLTSLPTVLNSGSSWMRTAPKRTAVAAVESANERRSPARSGGGSTRRAVSQAGTKVSQAVNRVVTAGGGFFSGLFGGWHP